MMKTLWEDNRVDEEEVWSAIRFLDPHERAKGYEIEPEGIPIGTRVPAKAP